MSHVTFWWKPGCATNTRQIRLLEAAGCTVLTYSGNEISLKAEGGATCLTRPIRRSI